MAEHDENPGDLGRGLEGPGGVGGLAKATGSSDPETPEPGVDASVIGSHFMGDTPSGVSGARRPAPETIGPYRVRGVLGEGGFGVVYLAEQEKPIRRQVAIKLLRAGRENDQVIARFQRERQSLVRMEHPGIARVFEASELPDGRPYIVMEFVKGLPLTTYCDDAKLSLRARLELVGQVCRAVQHAHTKGMIHRDLKPSNVLVAVSDGAPVVKIIDFGIAKPVEMHEGEQTVYTQLNQIVGTPGYMSPEQVRGSLDLDTRTDVYSIGVMLYELLAGAMPLDPALFRNKTAAQAERLIAETEPQRPSTRVSRAAAVRERVALARATDAEALTRELRGELDWVVMKCLEKDPARRYQSPAELEQDLLRYLAGEAVEAVPPTLGYRARKYVRRHRALVVSASAIVLALVGGLASAGYGLYRANVANTELTKTNTKLSEAIEEATRQEKKATREAARSGAFLKLFVDEVLGSASPRESAGVDVSVGYVLDQSVKMLDEIEDPSVRADVEYKIGFIYSTLGRYEEAYHHLRSAVEMMERDPETPRETVADANLHLQRASSSLGRDEFGLAYAMRGLEIRREHFGATHPLALEAMSSVASAMVRAGRQAEGAEMIESAVRTFAEIEPPGSETDEHLVVLAAYSTICLVPQARHVERFELTERMVAAAERIEAPELDLAAYLRWHADAARSVKKFDRAISSAERSLEIEERISGETTQLASAKATLALVLSESGDPVRGEVFAREAVTIYERELGINSEGTSGAIAILAKTYQEQGRFAEAADLYGQVASIRRNLLGEDSWRALASQSLQGENLARVGRFEEAEALLLDAERRLRNVEVATRPYLLTAERLVALYENWGKMESHEQWKRELDRLSASEPSGGP